MNVYEQTLTNYKTKEQNMQTYKTTFAIFQFSLNGFHNLMWMKINLIPNIQCPCK